PSITAACGEPTGHKKKPPPEAAMIYPRTLEGRVNHGSVFSYLPFWYIHDFVFIAGDSGGCGRN
ncbi:MAG: hypothetical protein JXA11_06280, partial [Phycisphaerae bacterium]|nr:hypothetical protein [Phycisphaerae bacterium]